MPRLLKDREGGLLDPGKLKLLKEYASANGWLKNTWTWRRQATAQRFGEMSLLKAHPTFG